MSPYLAIQKKKRSAENHVTLGIWLMILGFGVLITIAWTGSGDPVLTVLAVLGFIVGIIGINVSLNGRNLRISIERTFDALVLANARYKDMKKDSVSTTYKNTIKHLFKKG